MQPRLYGALKDLARDETGIYAMLMWIDKGVPREDALAETLIYYVKERRRLLEIVVSHETLKMPSLLLKDERTPAAGEEGK